MDNAPRRVLGLVAVASWLLIDAGRAAGPLLSDLFDTSLALAVAAALVTFAAGGVIAWLAALAGRHFGHGAVVLFMIAVVAVARLGLPLLGGGWLVAAGLYLAALTLTTVVLTARVALGNGGPASLLAGTSLGAAAAVAEQTVLRTWDAIWREDAMGWIAIGAVAALAVVNGWRTMRLEPVASSRGWWAFGLYWSLLAAVFANVAWLNAQTDLRMSASSALAIVSLVAGAVLAAQVRTTTRITLTVLAVGGAGALSVLLVRPGLGAAIALPIAVAVTTLATAAVMRPAASSAARRLGAATVFGLAIIVPILLVQLDATVPLPFPAPLIMATAGIAVMGVAVWRAWLQPGATAARLPSAARSRGESRGEPTTASAASTTPPVIAPGVLLRAAVGLVVAGALAAWTSTTYESPRALSADFLAAPTTMTWNTHLGIQPGVTGGPAVPLGDLADTIRASSADVAMLQEVNRGWILGGGTDVLEYLAGELQLPYSYAGAHDPQFGNAIFTSRTHANPRSTALAFGDGPQHRSAVAVDFMGATFVSTHLQSADAAATRETQAQELVDWTDAPQPVVIGGDLNAEPESSVLRLLADAGFVRAQDAAGVSGVTYLGRDPSGAEALTIDYLLGRGVEFTSFATLGVPFSDHLPLVARVATGATAPTGTGDDVNEVQPEAGASPSPSPSASPSASASPTTSE